MALRSELPLLGVGLGFREPIKAELFLNRSEIDFLEITADHFLEDSLTKRSELGLLKESWPVVMHSLDLSLGSAEGIDERYLEKLAGLVEHVQPVWLSDHICFTKAGGVSIGHLTPLPFTEEALRVLVRNIEVVRKRIPVPLILENITHNVEFPWSEMSESRFISRVLEETDCGLLLDVTNLYINSRNLGYDWRAYLDELPVDRIVQLHFVGSTSHGTRLIDGHASATQSEIWNVFREVSVRCDIKGAILERDENFPPFAELVEEMRIAREILRNGVTSPKPGN